MLKKISTLMMVSILLLLVLNNNIIFAEDCFFKELVLDGDYLIEWMPHDPRLGRINFRYQVGNTNYGHTAYKVLLSTNGLLYYDTLKVYWIPFSEIEKIQFRLFENQIDIEKIKAIADYHITLDYKQPVELNIWIKTTDGKETGKMVKEVFFISDYLLVTVQEFDVYFYPIHNIQEVSIKSSFMIIRDDSND